MSRVIKKDLIIQVSNKTGIKAEDVTLVIDAFLEEMAAQLGRGVSVALREFGTFDHRVSRRGIGRNPKQPDIDIHIPDKHVVRFKPAATLKQQVAALPVTDQE